MPQTANAKLAATNSRSTFTADKSATPEAAPTKGQIWPRGNGNKP